MRKSLRDATMEAPCIEPPQNTHHISKKLLTVATQVGLSLEALVVTKSAASSLGMNHKDCMSDSLHARALRKLAQDSFACDNSSAKKVIESSAHKKTKKKTMTQLAVWNGKRPSVSYKHQQRGSSSTSAATEGAASIDSISCSSLNNLQKSSMCSDLQLPDLSSITISPCHPKNHLKFLNTRGPGLSKLESLEAELHGSEPCRSSGQSLICVAGNYPSSKNAVSAAAHMFEAKGLVNLDTGGSSQDEIAVSGIPWMCGGSSKILDQSGPNLMMERSRGSRIKNMLMKSAGMQKLGAQEGKIWTWGTIPTPAAVDSPSHENIIRGNLRSSSSSVTDPLKQVQNQVTIDEKLSEITRVSNPWSGILPQDFRLASDLPPLQHYSKTTRKSINCYEPMKEHKRTETYTMMARSPADDGASLPRDEHLQVTQQHIRVYKKKVRNGVAWQSTPQLLPAFDKKKELVDCNATSTMGRTVHIPSRHKGGSS